MERKYIGPIGEELYVVNTGDWRTHRPVIDQAKCSKCGTCLLFCPVSMVEKRGGEFAINLSNCKGCGLCAYECPRSAIAMVEEGGAQNV